MNTPAQEAELPAWDDLHAALVDELDVLLDELVERFLAMRSYEVTDPQALRGGTRENLLIMLEGSRQRLTAGEESAPETRAVFVLVGETRARQGIAVSHMMQAWRMGADVIINHAKRLLADHPFRDRLLLELFETIHAWADFGMLASSEGHRRAELELSRQKHHAQANFVRGVLFGSLSGPELRGQAEVFRIGLSDRLRAVRARPVGDVEPRHVERFLGSWDDGQRRNGVVALVDGDVCGFVREIPFSSAPCPIGVSEPVELHQLVPAFRHATRALDTAMRLNVNGLHELPSLGLLPAIAADDDVGEAMLARYVTPIAALGSSGETILATVERYIENDRRLEFTANELHVHANTVRYRVGRYEELAKCSLRSHLTLFEVWWGLQRRRLR